MVLLRLSSAHLNGAEVTKGIQNVTFVTRIRYGTLATLVEIMDTARKVEGVDFGVLKKSLFEAGAIKEVLNLHVGRNQLREGTSSHHAIHLSSVDSNLCLVIEALFRATLDSGLESDRALISEACDHWLHRILSSKGEDASLTPILLLFIPFMEDAFLFRLLDLYLPILSSPSNANVSGPHSSILSALFSALTKYSNRTSLLGYFKPQMPTLCQMISDHPEMHELTKLISYVMCENLPLICSGVPFEKTARSISSTTRNLASFWDRQSYILPPSPHIASLLNIEHWDSPRDKLVAYILYFSTEARKEYSTWLQQSDALEKIPRADLIASLSAWLDTIVPQGIQSSLLLDPLSSELMSNLLSWLTQASLENQTLDGAWRSAFRTLISVAITSLTPNEFQALLKTYIGTLRNLEDYLLLVEAFGAEGGSGKHELQDVLDPIMEGCLPLVTNTYSAGEDEEAVSEIVRHLGTEFIGKQNTTDSSHAGHITNSCNEVKAHVAEPVLQSIVQNELSSHSALELAISLVAKAPVKVRPALAHCPSSIDSMYSPLR